MAAVGTLLLLVVLVPLQSSTPWAPKSAVLLVLGSFGLPFLAVRAWRPGPGRAGNAVCWSARLAVAFAAVAVLSSLLSIDPGFSLVGPYNQGTGAVFWVLVAGAYGLGTSLDDAGRRWFEGAVIAGAVANAAVAVLQSVRDLSPLGIFNYNGLPDGLLGNPVFMAPVLVAGIALVVPRLHRAPLAWGACAVLLAAGLGVSTERFPALLLFGVLAWAVARSWRHPGRWPMVGFAAAVLAGLAAGSLLGQRHGSSNGVIARTVSSNSGETFGQRFEIWHAAWHAVWHHPLVGIGPGNLRGAVQGLLTPTSAPQIGGAIFTDAHDIFVEVAVTTGFIGLALFAGWLVTALVGRRGALVVVGLVLLGSELVEPVLVTMTPLGFLALGAAVRRTSGDPPGVLAVRPPGRPTLVAATVLAVVAALAGISLLAGDILLLRANGQFGLAQTVAARANAVWADRLLPAWPEPAQELAKIDFVGVLDHRPGAGAATVGWAATAAQRNPYDPALWVQLANYQFDTDDLAGVRASAARAVATDPWSATAAAMEATVQYLDHHRGVADFWWRRSLAVNGAQPVIKAQLRGQCLPMAPSHRRTFNTHCIVLGNN